MAEITKIELLNGKNYQSWKYNIKLVLMERGLWSFIAGGEESPPETATTNVRNAYRLRSDKAYSLIALSVEKNLQVHISTTTDPKIAWDTLKNQFECVSITQVVRLNRKFYAATMNEGTDILEHLTHMTTLAEQLREMNEEISDKKFATVVLGSLPESYDNLISSLNTQKIEELNWENIKALLIEEQLKRTEKGAKQLELSSRNEALFSKKGGMFGNKRKQDYNPRQRSREYNHRQRSQEYNPRQRSQERSLGDTRCFKCGKLGHIVRNCPLNKKDSRNQSNFAEGNNEAQGSQKKDDVALSSATSQDKGSLWYIDSGATKHMTSRKDLIVDYIQYPQPSEIFLGDDRVIKALGEGKVSLEFYDGSNNLTMGMYNVLYVPEIAKNLVSVSAMTGKGAEVLFENDKCYITKDEKTMNIGHLTNSNLYVINTEPDYANVASSKASLEVWHCRFGHINHKYVNDLSQKKMVTGMSCSKEETDQHCEACAKAKMHRVPVPKASRSKSSRPLQLIHSDVCGPMNVNSIAGSKYVLSFTDDYTKYVTVYFLKNKSEVLSKFEEYESMVTNATGLKIQTLRSDNGGEYTSKEFAKFCTSKGIMHQFTNPYTPEQNGVSERLNRTLIESGKSMLFHAGLPLSFWAEAVNTATYLHNRSPISSLPDKTPYECWYGTKPDVSNLRVFGSICFVHTPDSLRQKLDPKSEKGVLVGYPLDTKGYKIYNIESKKFIRSKDVLFHENKFHDFQSSAKKDILLKFEDDVVVQEDEMQENVPVEPVIAVESRDEENVPAVGVPQPGASYEENFMRQVDETVGTKRQRKPPQRFLPDECNVAAELTNDDDEPKSMTDALNSKNSGKWMQALEAEYNSLVKSETWELVPPPDDANIVGSKWVFKVKRKANGEVDRYKARLVAQGYTQTYGIDYEEVFSPVARYSSIRTLLALANSHDLEIHQMDVTTAFLNGSLEHDIYMKQPENFVDPEHPDHVCKLKRSIYGLKQSARCWNQTIDTFLMKNGYRKSSADSCIYIKSVKQENGFISFVILAVYVDDIIPVSNDSEMLRLEKQLLSNEFQMVDQGELQFILGMSIKRDREKKTLFISQEKYLESILNRFNMQDSKPVSTPLETGKSFHKRSDDEKSFDKETYQQAIGCLTYVSTATRPDIAMAVGMLSQYMADPSNDHWLGIKRLLRYIKGTLTYGLKFVAHENEDDLYGFADADWAGDIDTRRSTSGYVFMVANGVTSWSSKKQSTVAKSTTEAEYVALSQATQEAIWLRRLLSDLGCKANGPTLINEDNQGAIEIARNPKFHNRTKHIDTTFHFIREKIVSKEIKVDYCSTHNMIADIMTKALPRDRFEKLRSLLNVCSL